MSGGQQFSLSGLRQLATVRSQCARLYSLAEQDKLRHFSVHEDCLPAVADYIFELIRHDYPTLDIPFHSRWRHFEAGGIERHRQLEAAWNNLDSLEKTRRHIDLVVVSVLLDAGAGGRWAFTEAGTGQVHGRSEGLGIASLRMFADGRFSSDRSQPFQVDADGLAQLTLADLRAGFQESESNPLLGLEGRLSLLRQLSVALKQKSEFFSGPSAPRPAHLLDWLLRSQNGGEIALGKLWTAVIEGFEDVWPRKERIIIDGRNLGDAWKHSLLAGSSANESIVPFHKLSQWLTYSLLEPLITGGFRINGMDELTGLPEYRNGGLFVDFDVLKLKDPAAAAIAHPVSSELVVEWRALTVILLDKTAALLRKKMNLSETEFPLAKVLEAGTWKAGRRIAAAKRTGGTPPLQVVSDGTVF
ncbi:MAG: hypothetical protein RLZZ488_1493 [Pseudomonadota bacterium]|jgi:hypothetical protein